MEAESAMSIAELRKSLECPVCFETPKAGPLYQCQNGHILCSVCIDRVQECPQCRVNLPSIRIRCLFAEQQLQKLPVKCKYCNHGCDFEQLPSKKEALNDHEKECQHRNISCILVNCTAIVSLSKLSLHLKNHRNLTVDVTGAQLKDRPMILSKDKIGVNQWISWRSTHFILMRTAKEFYSAIARSPDGFIFLWVYIIGTAEEEENFTCTITLSNKDKTQNRSCKSPVISVDTPPRQICSLKSSMSGLIIPDAVFKKLGGDFDHNTNGKLNLQYSISINNNNPEKRKHSEN